MAQADSNHTTIMQNAPTVASRRSFLTKAAGVVAGGTVLALAPVSLVSAAAAPAGSLDPIFALIEAHRTAQAAHIVALAERSRLESIGDLRAAGSIADGPCGAAMNVTRREGYGYRGSR